MFRSSSLSGCCSPGYPSSNEVPDSANGGPRDINIKQDSSFKSTSGINKEEVSASEHPHTEQTQNTKKIMGTGNELKKKSGGAGTKNSGGNPNNPRPIISGDRAKMSKSAPNSKPSTCDLSVGSIQSQAQKVPSMNSTSIQKKPSSLVKEVDMKKEARNSKPIENHKSGIQASTNSSPGPTMHKKSVSVNKNPSLTKKTTDEKTPRVSQESQKKTSTVDKERGGSTSKKTSITKPGKNTGGIPTLKEVANMDAEPHKNTSEPSGPVIQKQKNITTKNSSLEKRPMLHKPIEKSDSSVSLARKKFEKKLENNEHGTRTVDGARKLTEPLPKVKISQNVFLQEDAQKRKPKARTQEVHSMCTDSDNSEPWINKDRPSESVLHSLHSKNDSLQMNSKDTHNGGPLFSGSADLVPSPKPCEKDLDLNCQNESINSIQNMTIIHTDVSFTDLVSCPGETIKKEKEALPPPGPVSIHSTPELDTEPSLTQPIPDLNIDDVPSNEIESCRRDPDRMDTCDRSLDDLDISDRRVDRLVSSLDHELPESPAYRSPCLSDSSDSEEAVSSRHHVLDAFVPSNEEPGLRNKLLSHLVNKRSESDGIVCMDRPKADKPVRRCESIDEGMDQVSRDMAPLHFGQNIKTVTPATIMKGPEDYTAGLQETVYLRAHYFGNPEPRVAWYKGGRRMNHTERIKIRTYPGESTLVIRDLRADDSGKYEIQIENEIGNDSASASLCVEGPPEPPGGRPYITTIDKDALRLTLAWYGATFDGGSMLTGYIVEMSSWVISSEAGHPEPTDWTTLTSKCHSTSYIVRNLDIDREYIFRVKAQNIHGPSSPGKISEPVSFLKIDDEELTEDEDEDDSDGDEFDSQFDHHQVSLEDGNIFKEKFEIYEELGRGRFGVVFKVRDNTTRELFAAKFVRCRKQEERDKCKEEISIMNGLDHSRLLQLAAAYENPREVIMIMEFIGGGELFEKVVADDFTLTERDCVLFMRQISTAIGYMHQQHIVHLDLKPENILCKSKRSHQIKIIDFGLTRKLKPGEDVRILFGTPEFVSPEVISYEPVSASSDMWSVGVVCYVLLSGLSPFMGDSDVETFANITGMCYDFEDEAFDNISEDAKDFILKLLVKDQRKRMKALECLKHPWLSQGSKDKRNYKEINTDKLKSFLMRRRWQKAAHAIRALGRFTSLGFQKDSKDAASSISAFSTQSANF